MSKTIKNSATCVDTICLSVQNDATHQADFYLGQSAVLDIKLVNATGADIALQGAKLDIFFLSLNVGLPGCRIDLPGWTFSAGAYSLTLKYSGAAAEWDQGDFNALQFQISGVQSSLTQATAGFFQVNFSDLSGQNLPGRLKTPLNLIAAPQPGNASLDLSLGLADGGIIYVSQPSGSLVTNRLVLNVINQGAQPLFSGTPGQQGQPQIAVSFVYGTTPGALAPDADKNAPQSGSAWDISGKVSAGQGNDWAVTNPSASGSATDPVWLLTPAPTNSRLIGTGDSAAVQFEFDQIISQTQPGVTLMYVQLSGFKKDDNTLYNDQLFVLPVTKENLPLPGLIRFSSEINEVEVHSSSQKVRIPLKWCMTGVSKINLHFHSDDMPGLNIQDKCISYLGVQPALQYGQYTLEFQGIANAGSLLVTCKAYNDANDCDTPLPQNSLSVLQFTVDLDFPPLVTAYTGEVQADGSLKLQWTTDGATSVMLKGTGMIYGPNVGTTIDNPEFPLLNNDYYSLVAKGPRKDSAACLFKFPKFGSFGSIAGVGRPATNVVISPKGDHVFVGIAPDKVSVIKTGSGLSFNVLSPAIGVETDFSSIAVSSDGDYLFVTNPDANTVSVFDIGNGPPFKVLSPAIRVGGCPMGIAVSPKGDYVFVCTPNDSTVSVIDVKNGPPFAVLSPAIPVGSGSTKIAMSPKGDYVFVTNDSTVSVIDIRNGPPFKVLSPAIDAGCDPGSIAVSPKDDHVFVANSDGNTNVNSVTVIDIRNGPPLRSCRRRSLLQVAPGVLPLLRRRICLYGQLFGRHGVDGH